MKQVQIVPQTIEDFREDRKLWLCPGRAAPCRRAGNGVYAIDGAQIAAGEPVVSIVIVDLGPARLVVVTPQCVAGLPA